MLGQFFDRLRSCSNRIKITAVLCAVLVPATIVLTAGAYGLRLNLTNSVPIGIYLISDTPGASLIDFCPPEPFGTLSRDRGYRELSPFGCPDGAKPLLKPIAARPGNTVSMSTSGITVDGKQIPHSAPLRSDTAGRPISAWPLGVYQVQNGTMWVASSFNSHSFDSRYFGPVPESAVLHHLRPLWIAR